MQSKIWRVWVIWGTTEYAGFVIVLPSLCFLAFTALQWRTVVLESTLPIQEAFKLDGKSNTAENALQGATTMLCTILISGYLIYQRRRHSKLIGESQISVGYISIVAMLVESYAAESVWLFVAILINGPSDHPVVIFFGDTATYIEIIAYLLVLYRVAKGRAYESRKGQRNISSLNWNHSTHVTGTTQPDEISPAPIGHVDVSRVSMA
ncbi:hypothetical protein Agabi119p4_5009 [Agaricus bisporus var. burnettii]|uniref:Uncharacterized protein n=1 Tax=Agaricus bisporus var. burnettii TaxID=192524 RepID=A0A8H7F4C4_AGABI|nr:hypothetical protein Agabi119p4_5009 [Agaricus bisporus var. burnettii]